MSKGVVVSHVGEMGWISGKKKRKERKKEMDWKIIIL